eukprot:gb/GFBE01028627.1/.p1 GENE.gb/GFBE01028627.1/~~gb/GFBE01028627.1/.p1  ORF type:complete len:513 (+),score=139.13 gb/GFBE01028627.1/:1-1539(+)
MGRIKAVHALQDALVSQFGKSARGVVEAEVDSRLAGRKKLTREDLDAIEAGVLMKLRTHRSSVGADEPRTKEAFSLGRSRSAPTGLVALSGVSPPSSPQSRTMMASTQGTLSASIPVRGAMATLPRAPQVKPFDCFDLFAEYNTAEFAREAEEKRKEQKAKARKFRETLDVQMDEVRAIRAAEAEEKRKLREQMLAQEKANQEAAVAELKKEQELKELRRQTSMELLATAQRKRDEEVSRVRLEKGAFEGTMKLQESQRMQELAEREQDKTYQKTMYRSQFDECLSLRNERKRGEKEADLKMAKEWARKAAAPSAAELPGGPRFKIQQGQERVTLLVTKMGVPLLERQKAQDRATDHRIEMQRRAHEKQLVDDYWRGQDEHSQKVADMVKTREWQVRGNIGKGSEERAEGLRQVEVWRKEAEQASAEELRKEQSRRQARKDMDDSLFGTMLQNVAVHKSEKGVTEAFKQRELAYNKPQIEQLAVNGFNADRSQTMLMQATLSASTLKTGTRR